MPDLSDGEFAEVMGRVLEAADRKEQNAAFGGEMHDGGAREMRASVDAFRCGMNRRIPEGWLTYVREMRQEQDPEWAEYTRLRAKFEPSA